MCTDSGTQTTRGKHRLVAIEETTTNDHKRPQTRPPLGIPAVRTLDFSHLNICPMAVLLMTPDPSVSYM